MKPAIVGRVMPPRPFSPPVTSVQRNDDRIEHRGQRQRQQREVDAAPPQDQKPNASEARATIGDAHADRDRRIEPGKQVALELVAAA